MVRLFVFLSLFVLPMTADAFSSGETKGSWTGKRFKEECVEIKGPHCENIFSATYEAIRHVDQNAGLYLVFQHQKLKQVLRKEKASDTVKAEVLKYTNPKLRQTISKCFAKDKDLYETVIEFVGRNSSNDKRALSEIIHLAAFEHWTCKRPK